MNRDKFKIIDLRLLLILYVEEEVDVVEAHELTEDPTLYCYRYTLVFLITLME